MNATAILVAQHRAIEDLFDEVITGTRRQARGRAASHLTEELIVHMAAEENVFYPAARPVLAGARGPGDLGGHAPDEHFMLRAQLRRVLATNLDAPAFVPRFEALRLLFAHHVDAEENEIFPRVEAAFTASELAALGVEVLGARPPIWLVTTEARAAMIARTERSNSGVRLPSLREN